MFKPRTQVIAGVAICAASLFLVVINYTQGHPGQAGMGFWTMLIGAYIAYKGYGRLRQERISGDYKSDALRAVQAMPQGARAKRKLLIYTCINVGIVVTDWIIFQNGLPAGLVIASCLISLVLLNALVFFVFRRMGFLKGTVKAT
jgi:hypothetical protein